MPSTEDQRLKGLLRRIALRREKEDAKQRRMTESAKEAEKVGK